MKLTFQKRIIAMIVTVWLLSMFVVSASAFIPYDSFNFIYSQGQMKRAQCPAPYYPEQIIEHVDNSQLLVSPIDICFTSDKKDIFVVDNKLNKLIRYSADWEFLRCYDGVTREGQTELFQNPKGVFVTENKEIYVADTDNHRIVVMDYDGNCLKIIEASDRDLFGEDYVFSPKKLVVSGQRLLVVAEAQYNGVMEFNIGGKFIGFLGSNTVSASPVEILLRSILTREQRDKMLKFVPMEYANMCLEEDFIYVVTQATDQDNKIRKLNVGGQDIMIRSEYMMEATKLSRIEDICTDPYGNYYYIDAKDGKVYAYNQEGYLLYAFGDLSSQLGNFKAPSAIEYKDGRLYVCDSVNGTITVFNRTSYAETIERADVLFRQQNYSESMEQWEEVLRLNSNFEQAYVQIGRILYRQGNYEEAMEYFKKGNYRGENYVAGYGMAFEKYRAEFLKNNLTAILTVILVVAVVVWLGFLLRKRRKG